MQAEGLSLCAAAKTLCVSASNHSKWASQGVSGDKNHNDNAAVLLQALDDTDGDDEPNQWAPDGVLGDCGGLDSNGDGDGIVGNDIAPLPGGRRGQEAAPRARRRGWPPSSRELNSPGGVYTTRERLSYDQGDCGDRPI